MPKDVALLEKFDWEDRQTAFREDLYEELHVQAQHKNRQLEQSNAALEAKLARQQEEINWFKQQLFGRSSEKGRVDDLCPDQGCLFNEAEVLSDSTPPTSDSVTIPAHTRKKKGRKKLPVDLPRVDIVHDLPDDQKHCVHDGAPLQRPVTAHR